MGGLRLNASILIGSTNQITIIILLSHFHIDNIRGVILWPFWHCQDVQQLYSTSQTTYSVVLPPEVMFWRYSVYLHTHPIVIEIVHNHDHLGYSQCSSQLSIPPLHPMVQIRANSQESTMQAITLHVSVCGLRLNQSILIGSTNGVFRMFSSSIPHPKILPVLFFYQK